MNFAVNDSVTDEDYGLGRIIAVSKPETPWLSDKECKQRYEQGYRYLTVAFDDGTVRAFSCECIETVNGLPNTLYT